MIEKEIIEQLKINPYMSQKELAEKVGLSRSSIANYITRLIKSGVIKGRAYIFHENPTIVCIGGMNMDRVAYAKNKIRLNTSNPVEIKEVCGGVARNFAETINYFAINSMVISCVSNDKEGLWIINETKKSGIDVSQVIVFPSEQTGSTTDLIDLNGESIVSIADTNIYNRLTPTIIEDKWNHISNAKAVIIDTNLSTELIMYIKDSLSNNMPIFIETISPANSLKIPEDLKNIHLINPTKEEAEVLVSMNIYDESDYKLACKKLYDRGVKNIILRVDNNKVYLYSKDGFFNLNIEALGTKSKRYEFYSSVFLYLIEGQSLLNACYNTLDRI